MRNKHPPTDRPKLSQLKIAFLYGGFAVGVMTLFCVMALLCFPDPLVNRFIKPKMTKAFADAYPAYSISITDMNYSVLKNRFGFESVTLNTVDGTFSIHIGPSSLSGIGWVPLLWGRKLGPNDFANSVVDAQDIEINFLRSQYELRCGLLHISVPDSEIVVEALNLHPSGDDEHFFAESEFRKTRFRLVAPRARVMDLACLDLMQGKSFRTRSVQIHDVFLDILVNKDKSCAIDSSSSLMPNEILSSLKTTLQADSLSILNGRLNYGERFAVGERPAWITFDSMQVLAEGIANHGDLNSALVIHAQGNFMQAGTMKVLMSIPVASPEFSFQYAGSLSGMDLGALNSFLEPAEQIRIKSGVLQSATFDINVTSGHANGYLRAVYTDLTFAIIRKETRSEKGFFDLITSFIANTFKIRGTNVPDQSGSIKIGEVKHTRAPNNSFIQFVWFALRTGVRDVVGL